ncbi:hypothetical protein [Granulosicoccus antarcticus]|uniref:Lipid A palmitoyltransferase PagP n=1 Tax=Granulosicoccus antarcticus IMCC3135 TaxID=1192854 RepID=A0A2Z2NZ82_9GAMM|nr:hypothetical protein [Granulosicoccus antarcticus]ASJ75241.1 hypothetical protein IMCC3135_25930 [Granulosicoccus antarcticus IMCC3135]
MKTKIFTYISAVIITLTLMLGSATAKADNSFLVLSTLSWHFENFDDRNAFTPGVGWEYSPSSKIGWHAGTLSDSFGYQSYYGGLVYASKPMVYSKVRLLLGATVVHKQYKKNAEPETKLLPFPAVEIKISKRSVLNISGSPAIDYADQKNNAVLFFQYKLNIL